MREEKKKRRRLERRWRRTKSAVDRDKFVKQKLKLRKLLEDSDTAFYSNLVMENSHSTKGLFKVLNNMLNRRIESPLPKHDSTLQLANEFVGKIQNHLDLAMNFDENNKVVPEEPKHKTQMTTFCHLSEDNVEKLIKKSPIITCDLDPLQTWILRRCGEPFVKIATLIINTSLQTSAMPDRFKLAMLNPHLKKAGLEIINANFRPVSNLAYASRLIERAVANQLVQHMVENDLFEPLRSACREGHSTETALLRVQNDLLMAMDKQKVSILVLLDLSAAFDTVNHSVLLERLSNRCGIKGEALKWFVSYLENRFQMVKVKDEKSKQVPLSCGVLQGSVLGPLLFLVYTLPLGDIVRKRGLKFHLYADDTQLYMSFSPTPECATLSIQQIEGCVQEIQSWMLTNMLELNGDKTELLLVGTPKQCAKLPNLLINIGNTAIKPSDKVRNLGAVFDARLSLKSHVNSLRSSARYYL